MTKAFLVWAIIILVLSLFADQLLSKNENQCQQKCARDGKDYNYIRAKRRSRPAQCLCTRQLSDVNPHQFSDHLHFG